MLDPKIMNEISSVEAHMPRTYDELIMNIDRFIFGAQKGFDLCTELLIHAFNDETEHRVVYKKAFALKVNEAEKNGVGVSGRGDYAASKVSIEESELIKRENDIRIARFKRDRFLERLNTYKKIKGDSVMQRMQQ